MIDFIAIPWDISSEFRTVVQVGESGDIEITTQLWNPDLKCWKLEDPRARIYICPKTVESVCKALKIIAGELHGE